MSNGIRQRRFILASASAAPSPRAVAMIAASAAMRRLVLIAGINVESFSPSRNQHVSNSFQTAMLPSRVGGRLQTFEPWYDASDEGEGPLNAKMTTTAIGR